MNHNWAKILARDPADGKGSKHLLFMSGNEKLEVTALLEGFGFQVIDLGRTDEGGLLAQVCQTTDHAQPGVPGPGRRQPAADGPAQPLTIDPGPTRPVRPRWSVSSGACPGALQR